VTVRLAGIIDGLRITRGEHDSAAGYELCFRDGSLLPLNEAIGLGLTIEFDGTVCCSHCGQEGRRSFGSGYCYECFKTLARCDLCVLSPDRCHYDQGTCREPDWGLSFCMQPHSVYLANSSGIKVGITSRGREVGRWLDQGAIQGLTILETSTRRAAGQAEAIIASLLPDRTDWRKMLRDDVPELDLGAAARELRRSGLTLPGEVSWVEAAPVQRLHYPLPAVAVVPEVLKLDNERPLAGNLLGMKGQYLLLSTGALNVRRCRSYQVQIALDEPFDLPLGSAEQLGLF